MKDKHLDKAKELFRNTSINITTVGQKYLGSFIGIKESKENCIKKLVNEWIVQVDKLSKIALFEPQAAYVSGFRHKFNYFIRTLGEMKNHLKPLDDVINNKFIPALTEGHKCTTDERMLLSLPIRYGGMGIPILVEECRLSLMKSLCNSNTSKYMVLPEKVSQKELTISFPNETLKR